MTAPAALILNPSVVTMNFPVIGSTMARGSVRVKPESTAEKKVDSDLGFRRMVPDRSVTSMTSFSAIRTSVAETASALSGGITQYPLTAALSVFAGPLITLLTVSVGGEGSETVTVPFKTENASPVYEEARVMVPREAPELPEMLNILPVLSSVALAAPATLMPSPKQAIRLLGDPIADWVRCAGSFATQGGR